MQLEKTVNIERLLSRDALAIISDKYGAIRQCHDADFHFRDPERSLFIPPLNMGVLEILEKSFNETIHPGDTDAVVICKILCAIASSLIYRNQSYARVYPGWAVNDPAARKCIATYVRSDLEILEGRIDTINRLSSEQYHGCIAVMEVYSNTGKFEEHD
ncbi:MAG: hypothetical protein U9Q67_01875 [Patescibacteria group bacterium]|nr:hypothetical protein [Patescibacteria group bacterium]